MDFRGANLASQVWHQPNSVPSVNVNRWLLPVQISITFDKEWVHIRGVTIKFANSFYYVMLATWSWRGTAVIQWLFTCHQFILMFLVIENCFLQVLFVVLTIKTSCDFEEQRIVMKFLVKVGKTNSEMMEIMRSVYVVCLMKRS